MDRRKSELESKLSEMKSEKNSAVRIAGAIYGPARLPSFLGS